MGEFLPFSSRSKPWEREAITLRKLDDSPGSEFCPWTVARKIGLLVLDGNEFLDQLPPDNSRHLKSVKDRSWSGGVYPIPLPCGRLVCILNPFQSLRRNKITLMEEVTHIHRDHRPTKIVKNSSGITVRDYDKKQEEEAYGIGAAALLPWSSFYHSLNDGMSVDAMSKAYAVSPELIEYRIKITGATSLFRSRQKVHSH